VESDVGYGDASRIDTTIRRSQKLMDFGDLAGEIEARLQALMPAMLERLGSPPFVASKFELELVAHNDGAFFARHTDTFKKSEGVGTHRMISGVYYFHAQPKPFTGGTLRLHSLAATGEPGTFVDIEPDNNTLVFFPSWFPHEVMPVACTSGRFEDSRFAINCWVHRTSGAADL
jgi:Rps23 Pro-64 3,4-dihydroxylase Tpa1-like proline 4-hydroxylase